MLEELVRKDGIATGLTLARNLRGALDLNRVLWKSRHYGEDLSFEERKTFTKKGGKQMSLKVANKMRLVSRKGKGRGAQERSDWPAGESPGTLSAKGLTLRKSQVQVPSPSPSPTIHSKSHHPLDRSTPSTPHFPPPHPANQLDGPLLNAVAAHTDIRGVSNFAHLISI